MSGNTEAARKPEAELFDTCTEEAARLVALMTVEEKAGLISGRDFWHCNGVERLGLPAVMVTDGPHGLRKQVEGADHLGLNESVPATCFPAACAYACSFDEELIQLMGAALGEECRKEDVAVILGPAVNIKRSPLLGRNFEYLSEDPLLAGRLAAALIRGVQSRGVGTSIKHFAGNNQETKRLVSDSVIDERALREIYLRPFEIALRDSQPWTVMSAYNKLNGVYCGEYPELLTGILRKEWGFEGAVMTDWGAINDPVKSFTAGLDLEMPGIGNGYEKVIAGRVKDGSFPAKKLDEIAVRLVSLILKYKKGTEIPYACDRDAHLNLAARIVEESSVLLKNDGILPGGTGQSIAVIGAFAKQPRYQGAGSSKINPVALDNAWDAFIAAGCAAEYAPGYAREDSAVHEDLIVEAEKLAAGKDIVYIFAGLPDACESEGFDRETIAMPAAHTELILRVSKANPNVVVVLQAGAPVDLGWEDHVRAILLSCLSGCQGGRGTVNLLLGKVNPSGKLAETFPFSENDAPCAQPSAMSYPVRDRQVQYRESIYVGYRYYASAGKAVRRPFGFGLSYTNFWYSDIAAVKNGELVTVSCKVTNTGARAGREVVQLYVSKDDPVIYRPETELKDFVKIYLEPGETKTVHFVLDSESYRYYSTKQNRWAVESGTYTIRVAPSSLDKGLTVKLSLENRDFPEDYSEIAPDYYRPGPGKIFTERSFCAVYGKPLPVEPPVKPFTPNSTIEEIQCVFAGKLLAKAAARGVSAFAKGDKDLEYLAGRMLMDTPLRQMAFSGVGIEKIRGLVHLLNGKLIKALPLLLKK
jgi:beta-glucosidase